MKKLSSGRSNSLWSRRARSCCRSAERSSHKASAILGRPTISRSCWPPGDQVVAEQEVRRNELEFAASLLVGLPFDSQLELQRVSPGWWWFLGRPLVKAGPVARASPAQRAKARRS